jgi:hypothetical protein
MAMGEYAKAEPLYQQALQIYQKVFGAEHPATATSLNNAEVQRTWLVKLRAEKGLAQAVNLAGPFIMSSQGKP